MTNDMAQLNLYNCRINNQSSVNWNSVLSSDWMWLEYSGDILNVLVIAGGLTFLSLTCLFL